MNADTAALIEMIHMTRRAQMREAAVRQLAERADPDAAPALLELLEDSNDPRIVPVVTTALAGLQRLGLPIAPLILGVLDGPSDRRRPFMPLLLASALGVESVPRLLQALDDSQLEVRINAATQLGELRDLRALCDRMPIGRIPAFDELNEPYSPHVSDFAISARSRLSEGHTKPSRASSRRESCRQSSS